MKNLKKLQNLMFYESTTSGVLATVYPTEQPKIIASDHSKIRMKKEAVNFFNEAASWFIGRKLDFNLSGGETDRKNMSTIFTKSNDRLIEVTIPGTFDPPLDEKDISEMIKVWGLLKDHFPNFKSLLAGRMNPESIMEILFFLISEADGKLGFKLPWVNKMMEVRGEKYNDTRI